MIETQKRNPKEILEVVGERMLADAAVDVDASAVWAERLIRSRFPHENVSVFVYRVRYYSRIDGTTRLYWRVSIDGEAVYTCIDDAEVLNEAVSRCCQKYATESTIRKQLAEAAAADSATKHETGKGAEHRNSACVSGSAPKPSLTSGPSCDATKEAVNNCYPHTEVEGAMPEPGVCGDCGRPDGEHIHTGNGKYRCATEKEAANYQRDIES